MIIRKATADDIPAVTEIYAEIHDREEAGETTTGWLREIYPIRATAEAALKRGDLYVQEVWEGSDAPGDEAMPGSPGGSYDSSSPGAPRVIVGTGIINQIQVDVYEQGAWECPAADDEVLVLHTLIISKKTKYKGLGTEFLKYYEDRARESGCRSLRLDTNARNQAARAFYRKHGYREIGIVPTVFNGIPGVDLVLLEKVLRRKPMNILCYGDSNTYGYDPSDGMRYSEEIRWPCVLRELLNTNQDKKTGYTIIEEGCNGRTASCTPADEPWKDSRPYLPACLNSHKPLDLIILMLGSNDLKRIFHASPEDITAGIREHLQIISDFTLLKQGYRPRVLLISPPWIGEGIADSVFSESFDTDAVPRSQRLASLYMKEAEEFTQSGKLDCDFLDAAQVCQASEVDALHLMPEAHAALARAIAEKV